MIETQATPAGEETLLTYKYRTLLRGQMLTEHHCQSASAFEAPFPGRTSCFHRLTRSCVKSGRNVPTSALISDETERAVPDDPGCDLQMSQFPPE